MGVRERSQRKRKSPQQRKMKIPLTILLARVASLKAASLMDVIECPAQCCPATTNVPTTTADPTTGPSTTADPTDDPTTTANATADPGRKATEGPTGEASTTGAATTTADAATTTENICHTCDQSTCEEGGEGGAASASASILALLLPAVFARLL